jgi:hypothetical protein
VTKTLVTGWFSFEEMGATAGDLIARDLVCEWLATTGRRFDVAVAPPFTGGIDWRTADPAHYGEVVFVCGPFGNGWPLTEFLERFAGKRFIGLNVSMLEPLDAWNPFDVLIERDSSRAARPDVSFLSTAPKVPVAGVVLVHPQNEYPGAKHGRANAAIERLLGSREIARVPIDTRLDVNSTGLRTPAEVESLIARMDVVVTTRLHGTVLSIKNGVPPLVIDPIAGGRKVLTQARAIGWKTAFTADELDDRKLRDALDFCLSAEGRAEVLRVRERVIAEAVRTREGFIAAMSPAAAGRRT